MAHLVNVPVHVIDTVDIKKNSYYKNEESNSENIIAFLVHVVVLIRYRVLDDCYQLTANRKTNVNHKHNPE